MGRTYAEAASAVAAATAQRTSALRNKRSAAPTKARKSAMKSVSGITFIDHSNIVGSTATRSAQAPAMFSSFTEARMISQVSITMITVKARLTISANAIG